MPDMPKAPIVWVLTILFHTTSAYAIKEWESDDGEVYVSLIGAQRLTGAFLHVPDIPSLYPSGDDGLATSVSRLILEGIIGEHLQLELNTFLDISRQAFMTDGGAFSTAASFDSPYRTPYLEGTFWKNGAIDGIVGIDRLNVKLTLKPVTLTIGRAPINHSVTQIFTPNDYFAPFSATAVNTVYKPGVDAITIGVATGNLSLIEFSGVLGHNENHAPSYGQSAFLIHAQTVLLEVELALHGGKLAERWVAGGSVQAAAGRFNIRAEGHAGFPDLDGDFSMDDLDRDGRTSDSFHARLAVGIDTFFTWHNSSIGLEYMYLSDGEKSPSLYVERASRLFPDDPTFLGRHYLGLTASTEIIPTLQAMVMGLINPESPSGVTMASFVYSISDEADFVAGAMLPIGKRPKQSESMIFEPKSEYGHSHRTLFLESRFYF